MAFISNNLIYYLSSDSKIERFSISFLSYFYDNNLCVLSLTYLMPPFII